MSANVLHPTPYPDVNAVLDTLLSNVLVVLGRHFVGLYLYGSLASGDFDPHRSDIDVLVVSTEELPDAMIQHLAAMHTRLTASDSRWATKLEGAYIPQRALRRFNPNDAPYPSINEAQFYIARQGSDWIIQRHILREQGVTVAGPALFTLIDPVHPNDLRQTVLGLLREWWSPMLDDATRLRDSEYQAYAVLTLCRALHTLQYGTVVSKPIAARWAQATLGDQWAAWIEWAVTWRHDSPSDHTNETLDFIQYAIERGQQFEVLMEAAWIRPASPN